MENGRECYHCASGHPELARTFPVGVSASFGDLEESRGVSRKRMARARHADGAGRRGLVAGGALPAQSGHRGDDHRRRFRGEEIDVRRGRRATPDRCAGALEPNNFCHSTADHSFAFTAMPVSALETHVVSKWLVHEDAVEGVDYDIETLTHLWTQTNLQDKEFAENNQRGVLSPGYRPGPYSAEAESLTLGFVDWYCATAAAYLDGMAA